MRERRSLYSTSRFHHEIKLSASCTFEMNLAQHFSQLLPLAVRNRNWRRFAMFWLFFLLLFLSFFRGERKLFAVAAYLAKLFIFKSIDVEKKGKFRFRKCTHSFTFIWTEGETTKAFLLPFTKWSKATRVNSSKYPLSCMARSAQDHDFVCTKRRLAICLECVKLHLTISSCARWSLISLHQKPVINTRCNFSLSMIFEHTLADNFFDRRRSSTCKQLIFLRRSYCFSLRLRTHQ